MYKKRLIEKKLKSIFTHFSIMGIVGARQVGKSSTIRELGVKNLNTVVLDSVQDTAGAKSDPLLFLENQTYPLFIDEFQYAPQLAGHIKKIVDARQEKSLVILSGSQQFNVIKSLADSLAGRIGLISLWPMCLKEIEEVQNDNLERMFKGNIDTSFKNPYPRRLVDYIWRGGLPGIIDMPNDLLPTYFSSYITTYVERDVRQIAEIKNLELFSSFVSILAAQSSREINANELGRELGINRNTALEWKRILESSFQWLSIPSYTRNSIKKISKKHKGFFIDTGLICSLQKISSPDVILGHPLAGSLFETFIFWEIYKTVQSWSTIPNFYHYRAHSGAEVDLVLEIDGILTPIEIKLSSRPGKKDLLSLKNFREAYKDSVSDYSFVICSAETPFEIEKGIWLIPWWYI